MNYDAILDSVEEIVKYYNQNGGFTVLVGINKVRFRMIPDQPPREHLKSTFMSSKSSQQIQQE